MELAQRACHHRKEAIPDRSCDPCGWYSASGYWSTVDYKIHIWHISFSNSLWRDTIFIWLGVHEKDQFSSHFFGIHDTFAFRGYHCPPNSDFICCWLFNDVKHIRNTCCEGWLCTNYSNRLF